MRPLPFVLAAACLLLAGTAHATRALRPGSPAAARARAGVPARAPHAAAPASPTADLQRDTLAWVGERGITALDLVQRIEWMPWAGKNAGVNMDSVKVRALHALVAEALLAREGERARPGGGAALTRTREALRRALARDALYRELAASTPPPSPAEISALARRMHPEASARDLPAWRRAARDSLRELSGQRRATEFLVAHLAGQRVEIDSVVFLMLADSLRAYVASGHGARAEGGGTVLPAEAPEVLLAALSPALGQTFASLPDGPLPLGDALEDMRYYLFVVHSMQPRHFAAELGAQFRLLIQGELMGREALRRHMDERPDVRHDLGTWTDAWRSQSVLDSVATGAPAEDDEAFRTLVRMDPERARSECEVDVEEILCGSAAEAQSVGAALEAGASFDSLARRTSRRQEWAARGGRSGWFPVSEHPALGDAALRSPMHSLLGPLRLPEGPSVARVLGKRLRSASPDSAQAREALGTARGMATAERRSDRVARFVGSLANRVRIRYDEAALHRVDILVSNMVVRRTLGFGGGMVAAPSLPPLWQWPRYWSGTHAPLP